ncbi:MAG: glutamine synthetase family protein [Gammaproteobacteria bacterium]|uniref:glutamine synthetase family protein n=1 Tax=Hydrogenophaga sp. TaxID=1904254 RepID=UPI0025BBB16E|nr:glutamine synthetase family protein [Hydrogenophaga sp.]MBU4184366.1 glutamine synthetase family protein [Gammaproteobacteria bacterium]MBU4281707.1 glutamine synthetase family protein [Gammaproteobacteria bacterium]MBU4324312.1 glutamine synthetase family protein [Gammaproteobacteria bacterium]MBU4508534.1 glutamine synthetase family protein [Gammaproteobacteria bacterium]MCG2655093.1 glutamine synthetase family protein [Hydrogenophaga sp.]
MSHFAQRCGLHDAAREAACQQTAGLIEASGIQRVRLGWCDVHGMLRGKTLMAHAAIKALRDGVGMVGTLMLKDTADRTAWKVFEPGGTSDLPGFAGAANLMLLPDPSSFIELPWSPGTGWLRCQPWFQDATPVALDSRRVLQQALARLAQAGYGLKTGLEVEFHIYRITDTAPQLDPERADWPGLPPSVEMIHPGYNLQSEAMIDMADEPLAIVMHTAQALGLPLQSLEIELGPSQVEAVFDATDALTAADQMVLFRNGVRQALRRAGYHATFMCRPPFPHIMSSGWHLHQSLVDLATRRNACVRESPAPGSGRADARHTLSDAGAHWLAGLLAHAEGMTALCTPTVNGFGRFRPNALAPQSVIWGQDNRGAMLRVVGGPGDHATRIENRIGEPAANPYLYMAAQIHAGLDGLTRGLEPPPACETPYAADHPKIPDTLGNALGCLRADTALIAGLGADVVHHFCRIKQQEIDRHADAKDKTDFDRREYFSRI